MGKKQGGVGRCAGGIFYTLTYKKVKNLNLRVGADGQVSVSAPRRVPLGEVDAFVAAKAQWIARAQARAGAAGEEGGAAYSQEECLRVFEAVSARIYPLFQDVLPGRPTLRVRRMKSCWGVCHVRKNSITLNSLLLGKPAAALEYVVLHEYVHFLFPNHQQGFHDTMARLMPDYKQRRGLLK